MWVQWASGASNHTLTVLQWINLLAMFTELISSKKSYLVTSDKKVGCLLFMQFAILLTSELFLWHHGARNALSNDTKCRTCAETRAFQVDRNVSVYGKSGDSVSGWQTFVCCDGLTCCLSMWTVWKWVGCGVCKLHVRGRIIILTFCESVNLYNLQIEQPNKWIVRIAQIYSLVCDMQIVQHPCYVHCAVCKMGAN